MNRVPTCFIVGDGLIASRAFEILLDNRVSVLGVHTPDKDFLSRVRARSVRAYEARSAFREALESESFDYLFSVNNAWIIPDALLRKATRAAINYHDAPLPRYRGLYATSWALLNEEDEHGITWHEMVAGIDEGRILSQRRFAVTRADTAHALNARCYEEAISALSEIVPKLSSGIEGSAQDTGGSSYYGLGDRPSDAGFLDFHKSAASLHAWVRALDFGPVLNRFAAAKCLLGSIPVIVTRLTDTGYQSESPAGHVVAVEESGVVVATASSDVRISGVTSLDGDPLEVSRVCEAEAIRPGRPLDRVMPAVKQAWGARFARCARFEPYWSARLSALCPVSPPFRGQRLEAPGAHPLPLFSRSIEEAAAERRADAALRHFAAYAARLSGEPVFDLGLAVADLGKEDERIFAQMVPLRLRAAKDAEYSSFEEHVAAELTEARKRETFIKDLVARDPQLRGRPVEQYGLAVRVEPDERALPVPFDAALMLVLRGPSSVPELWAHEALTEHTVSSIDRQLAESWQAAKRRGTIRVADLPIVSEDEARLQVATWNQTERPYPSSSTLHALIAEQARRTPTAPAVRFGDSRLTYAELDDRSGRLAARLRRLGVSPGQSVAVSAARSTDFVVALLGVLKTGAAYVPIDPAYPRGRIDSIVSEAAPSAVVGGSREVAAFEPSLRRVLLDAAETFSDAPMPIEQSPASASDIAYVIFTSGSTGKPKGVEIPHRGIVNHGIAIRDTYALSPGDRMLCSASIGFDVCGEQIYPALLGGAEVVVRPEDLFESFVRFDDFVRHAGITAMVLPTSFWHEWTRALDAGGRSVPDDLRVLSVGTEKALPEFLSAWKRVSGGRVRFFQGYGPTETSVTCTMYIDPAGGGPSVDELPIGRPLPNVRVYVLDGSMRLLPVGMPGELYVGGDGLARGYRGRPDLTRERFVEDPFRPGERLYRTGDIARFLPDGNLVYVGRSDFQVKLRGYRIELGEIESTLRQSRNVGDAVVVLREDRGREPRIVAYVVPNPAEPPLDLERLSEFVRSRLPQYMIPSAIVPLSALPMTVNQKVDRKALPPPPDEARMRSMVPPRSELEKEIADLVTELMPGTSVGTTDDFFQVLGGSSLVAVQLLDRLERMRSVRIGLSAFTQNPTVAGLAALIERPETGARKDPVVVIQKGNDARAPLWLFPAVGGHVVYGEWLRRSMDPDQPLIGIEARGIDGRTEPLDRIEAMASAYLSAVRERQPDGPYYLAGPSMGGLVAIEVARQLRALGHDVPLLVLLDAWGPNFPTPTTTLVRLSDQFRTVWQTRGWKDRIALVSDRLRHRRFFRNVAPPAYSATIGLEGKLAEIVRRVAEAGERANARYSPLPYDGDVLLVRANRPTHWSGMRFDDPLNGWGPVIVGKIDVVGIDCDHVELADRPLPEVGRALQRALYRASGSSSDRIAPVSLRAAATA